MPDQDPSARRRIGGDVYLSPTPPGAGGSWRVDVGFAVADWKAAIDATATRAAFPGTAIRVGERWYEICRIGPLEVAPHRVAYDLWPWDDSNVIRTAFELTPEACETLTLRHRNLERRIAGGGLLGLFPFLTGLLPAADQKRLERELGVPAVRATMISAMVVMLPSVAVVMTAVALGLGTHFGELHDLVTRRRSW